MRRLALAAIVAICLGSSSGCCILDKFFGGCGCCSPCGAGGPCGGCNDCGGWPHTGPRHTAYGSCDRYGCGGCATCTRPGNTGGYVAQSGPNSAQIAYPYYTVRGPRDFLAKNPPSIGP